MIIDPRGLAAAQIESMFCFYTAIRTACYINGLAHW